MFTPLKTSFDKSKKFVKNHQTAITTTTVVVAVTYAACLRIEMRDLTQGIEMAERWVSTSANFIDDHGLMDEYCQFIENSVA